MKEKIVETVKDFVKEHSIEIMLCAAISGISTVAFAIGQSVGKRKEENTFIYNWYSYEKDGEK